ncbi:unnamed protein product [Amoebophrya sp. A120]|nr:unnamed protein product [Amoebophrya sp. A120]|eukprot:GSA120T00007780001.1
MSATIVAHSHGKASVKLLRLARSGEDGTGRHEMKKFNVQIKLHGTEKPKKAFTSPDNSGCVATDSMKNTIYVLAQKNPLCSKEKFSIIVASHFIGLYPHLVDKAECLVEEEVWERVSVDDQPHNHCWRLRSGTNDVRWSKCIAGGEAFQKYIAKTYGTRGSCLLTSGVKAMTLLKSTQSAWEKFVRDGYTLLPDTTNRILASAIDVEWAFRETPKMPVTANAAAAAADSPNFPDYDAFSEKVEKILIDTLCGPPNKGVYSTSVQATVHDMAQAVMSKHGDFIEKISLFGPNLHHIPFDFSRLNKVLPQETLPEKPEVFIATSEPRGIIEVTCSIPAGDKQIGHVFDPLPRSPKASGAASSGTAPGTEDQTATGDAGAPPPPPLTDIELTEQKTGGRNMNFLQFLKITTRQQFLAKFDGIYEKSPWILESAWPVYACAMDFQNAFDFFKHIKSVVQFANEEKKYALLRAHPDLAGKLAIATFKVVGDPTPGEQAAGSPTSEGAAPPVEKLTTESQKEQKSAGLDQCSEEEFNKFQALNDKYKEKFAFPFILAVSGRSRAEILEIFEKRMENTVEAEFAEAISQVHRIAEIRVKKLLEC